MLEIFLEWVKNESVLTQCTTGGEWYELALPFPLRNGEYLSIFIRKMLDGSYQLSDNGATYQSHLGDADDWWVRIPATSGVTWHDNELVSEAAGEYELGFAICRMVSAILRSVE